MEPNWAEENLQVIRTLMERSAMYRRALAPMMLATGLLGMVACGVGELIGVASDPRSGAAGFAGFWFCVAVIAVCISLFVARRQAMELKEPIFSPPARRIVSAMSLPILAGAILTCILVLPAFVKDGRPKPELVWLMVGAWMVFYGCALNAAGFFVSKGIRRMGWAFVMFGLLYVMAAGQASPPISWMVPWQRPHLAMGLTFGGFHLVAGIYLYFTEKSRNAQ